MEKKLNHLNMIQAVITRMANNSLLLKCLTVTLVSAMFVLSGKDNDTVFFVAAYVPVALFWFLDAYYLQLERKYRALYNETANKNEGDIDFSLKVLPSSAADKTEYAQSLLSVTEAGFYIPLGVLIGLLMVFVS